MTRASSAEPVVIAEKMTEAAWNWAISSLGGVAFTPGSAFFVDGGGEQALRLSFSSVPGSRIDEGVRRLAEAIRGQQKRPPRARFLDTPGVPVV